MTQEEMIKFYEDRIKHLEEMLEKSMEMNRTLMEKVGGQRPITSLPYPLPTQPNPFSNCPKCGLKLEGVMGYVCPNAGCPTGLGGAWCSTGEVK